MLPPTTTTTATFAWTFLTIFVSVAIDSVYNVPTARKTYDLHVPGKAPIRIIDADQSWNAGNSQNTDEEEFEHRTVRNNLRYRTTTKPPAYQDSEQFEMHHEQQQQQQQQEESTEFPSKLQEFLKNYAKKAIKKHHLQQQHHNYQHHHHDEENRDPTKAMDEIKLVTPPQEEEEYAGAEDDEQRDDNVSQNKQDKANKWDLIHVQKYQQPVLETEESNRYHSNADYNNPNPTKYAPNKIFQLNIHHISTVPQTYGSGSSNNDYKDSNRYPDRYPDRYGVGSTSSSSSFSNGYKDKEPNKQQGWVTLEAVPWSVSKVSKWESNKKRPWNTDSYGSGSSAVDKYSSNSNKYSSSLSSSKPWHSDNPNPFDQYGSPSPSPSSAYRPERPASYKPLAAYRPHSSYFSKPAYDKDDVDIYASSGSSGGHHGSSSFDQNPYNNRPAHLESFSERPWNRPSRPNKPLIIGNDYGRPYWNKLSQLHHNHGEGGDCDHNNHYKIQGDIITDGLPGNFPKESNRRRGVEENVSNERDDSDMDRDTALEINHPDTHPANGNGEWVLLSTTKGYQQPQKKQRSLRILPTTRQVRLTVLPPDSNSKVNMTTSHGGMLEVESSFQTVEEAQKEYVREMRLNATALAAIAAATANTNINNNNKIGAGAVAAAAMPIKTSQSLRKKLRNNKGVDQTAVVAAVGAGMIPAAAIGAMLVPMAMGRKKRSTFFQATTHPPLEPQIIMPRNM